MIEERSTLNPVPAALRSRIGTGRALFLEPVDGRSLKARRFREVVVDLLQGLPGGATEAQVQIARRAAALVVWCENQEAALATGSAIDIAAFTTASNTLRRLLETLNAAAEAANGQQAGSKQVSRIEVVFVDAQGNPVDAQGNPHEAQ